MHCRFKKSLVLSEQWGRRERPVDKTEQIPERDSVACPANGGEVSTRGRTAFSLCRSEGGMVCSGAIRPPHSRGRPSTRE